MWYVRHRTTFSRLRIVIELEIDAELGKQAGGRTLEKGDRHLALLRQLARDCAEDGPREMRRRVQHELDRGAW